MADAKPAPTRPLPKLDELDTRAFWQATAEGQLTYQECRNCGTVQWYPRAHCTGCVHADLVTRTASGLGRIYTYSIVRLNYHPFFRTLTPYAVAWIDLDEGPRVLSQITGVEDPAALKIGDRVKVQFEAHEGLAVPLFEPA